MRTDERKKERKMKRRRRGEEGQGLISEEVCVLVEVIELIERLIDQNKAEEERRKITLG